jgi:inorganic triphosphatase YgiF
MHAVAIMDDIVPDPSVPAPREIELKLFVPASSVERLWTHPLVAGQAIEAVRVARLANRYLDTPEHDLAAARMGLRLRRVGRQWFQTLKTAGTHEGALSSRAEWEMPVAGAALEPDRLANTPLDALGSPASLVARLRTVFRTDFTRTAQLLRLPDGTVVEFAFDTGSISVGRGASRRALPICELEIELRSAGTEEPARALLKFAQRLARDIPLIPLAASKAERGHRLVERRVTGVARARLPTPQRHVLARVHLADVLVAGNRALLANAHALFETGRTAEADERSVHQARVALRRIRSALHTFAPVVQRRRLSALDEPLRSVGRMFGRTRDWDVFTTVTMTRLEEKTATDEPGRAALAEVRAAAQSAREAARRALQVDLETGPFGATTLAIEQLAARLRVDDRHASSMTLDDCVAAWLDDQRGRVVRRSRRIAALDAHQRHGLRVETKRLRYALDLFDGLFDRARVEAFDEALTALQDKLGALNDATVARDLLGSLPQGTARDLILARLEAWLDRHVRAQLPKVAALSVALELTPQPWRPPAR